MDVFKWLAALIAMLLGTLGVSSNTTAQPLTFYAAASGEQALDNGDGGGNPFASAFIEALSRPSLDLAELASLLAGLTHAKSGGLQKAEVPDVAAKVSRQIVPRPSGESRLALVMVVSDYAKANVNSLDGARHDAGRIARALRSASFDTRVVLDADLAGMRAELARFARDSEAADLAVIYSTGHGVEVDGVTYLLPGDYPVAQRNGALATRALPVAEMAAHLKARHLNLAFWGGCRDNPLGK